MAELHLVLTEREHRDLMEVLDYEGVDCGDMAAVREWILYQCGVVPSDIPPAEGS
jgi:hypothetical protein